MSHDKGDKLGFMSMLMGDGVVVGNVVVLLWLEFVIRKTLQERVDSNVKQVDEQVDSNVNR